MTASHTIERPRLSLWIVVAVGGIITALSLGVRSTFGLLVGPISEGLGSDLGSISLAVAVQNLMWGFSQPIAGAISDRFGAPVTLAGGGILYAVAMALMSTAESSGMILLSGGFLTGIAVGAASFAVVLSAVGRMAPPEKRSMMLGVVSAIGSLGQFVLIPLSRTLLDRGSWESATLILAFLLVPIVLLAPLMRAVRTSAGAEVQDGSTTASAEPPRTLREDLNRAFAAKPYLLLNAAFFVCGFHVTFIGIHLAGFADSKNLSATTASTALALIGLFNVFGSLLVGALGQRHSYTKLLAGIYGLRAVVIMAYILIPISAASTIVFAMTMGLLWLSTVPPTSAIVAEQFGPTNAGALFGIVFLSHQLGSFLGAWMGGELVDLTNSYTTMWWISVGLGVFAMAMHLLLDDGPLPDPPPRDGGFRIAPAGLAAIVLILGLSAARLVVDIDAASADEATPASYCVLS